MSATLHHEHDNLYRVEIGGRLRKADLDEVQRSLGHEIQHAGKVRLLLVLTDFSGWEPGANWNDLTFYVRHGDDIERMAIVADAAWRSEVLMFAGAELRRAPVAFFTTAERGEADRWLADRAGDRAPAP